MEYIRIPKTISYQDLKTKLSLSPHSYKSVLVKNTNTRMLEDLITHKPVKGTEVGSSAYISKSPYRFIRNKALQSSSFLPMLEDIECAVPILPNAFVKLGLHRGDILISKDANVGESAFWDSDSPDYMLSGGLLKTRFPEELGYYVFAFMKDDFFRDQIGLAPRGATITHAKDLWLRAVIPFPTKANSEEIIQFVSLLTRAVIRKEAEIKKKYKQAMDLINTELLENQKKQEFVYALPRLTDIAHILRLDAGMFCEDYKKKQFIVQNYVKGSSSILDLGFHLKRGQNLQVSQIGHSIYTERYKPNFYKLIRPTDLTDYGTIAKYEYLGNPNKLETINKGDILFSAEGTIGKFYVFVDVNDRTITNIHGIIIFRKSGVNEVDSIFLGLFLGYLRIVGILDHLSVGGQGGSLAERYWKHIRIPDFQQSKKELIGSFYHRPADCNPTKLNLLEFDTEDSRVTLESGIAQLDHQLHKIKETLASVLWSIAQDSEVEINFAF